MTTLFSANSRALNRKLLVSVFNSQEAREAVLGGGRIIDSEDPKSALGNIKPRHIMDIGDAVLEFQRDLDVQLSTNIGEDQLLFRRAQTGEAIEKSPYEIAGKAAQAAIGVACSMGTRVHPVNYVKVGLDGMHLDKLAEVLEETTLTLNRTEEFCHCQIMAVLFAQDLELWNERRRLDTVRSTLVELREFNPASPNDPDAFDIQKYALGTLRNEQGGDFLFGDPGQVSLSSLIQRGVLPEGSNSTFVRTNELFEHRRYFPQIAGEASRTTREVIKAMVDVTADVGAHGIMIDTSILSKVANICLVNTSGSDMVDMNRHVVRNGMELKGILPLEDLRFFVDYCHYRGIFANLAGSIESFQAQQLWVLIPELDQCSTRGAASGVQRDPSKSSSESSNTRQHRIINRTLVRGLAPPEHGGVLNLPEVLEQDDHAKRTINNLIELVDSYRRDAGLPAAQAFYVNRYGEQRPV